MFKFPIRKMAVATDPEFLKGGQGSGNFGHGGRAGERGGSTASEIMSSPTTRTGRHFNNKDKNVFDASRNTFGQAKVIDSIRNIPKGERLVFHFEGIVPATDIVFNHLNTGGYVGAISQRGSNRAPQEFDAFDDVEADAAAHIVSLARNRLINS